MAKPVQYRRFMSMVVLLAIAFAGLGYRLVDLQVLQHEEILPQAEARTRKTLIRIPRRGNILDCRQTLLAGSEVVKTLYADPSIIGTNQFVATVIARAIAPILQTNEAWLIERFQTLKITNDQCQIVPRQYVVLKHKVSLEDWDKIRDTMLGLSFGMDERKLKSSEKVYYWNVRNKAVRTADVDDQLRFYPNGALAAHVLGFVGTEERRTNQQTYVETIGRTGIEKMLDNALTGIPGWRRTEVVHSRELATYRDQDIDPRNGHDVILTLDAGLQHILESELAEAMQKYSPVSASGVMVRPRTGEIVAMATFPTFDPNNPGSTQPDTWRNRVITDTYEPGSTFKIVTVSGALSDGLITLETQFDCERGYYWFANHRLKDDHPMGVASVEDIVAKSSNIGTAKIGLQMGRDRVYEHIRAYGFGERTGLGLQGEVRGLLDLPKKWSQLQSSRVPIGQGVAVTPLQMVMAMSTIANSGRLMQPIIVDRIVDGAGHVLLQNQPRVVRTVIAESASKLMISALKRVVSTNGTAPKAILEHYTVAGKTGTAEKPGPRGYVYHKYVASFMGFFPADNPELCIGIVFDDPKPIYYGGQTAAPTFKNIAERSAKYLALKPDIIPADAQMISSLLNRASTRSPNF